MKYLFSFYMSAAVGYLLVAVVVPDISFWDAFNTIFTAPFILFLQLIPGWMFEGINHISESMAAYSVANPKAEILGWSSVIVGFFAILVPVIYYLALIYNLIVWGVGVCPNEQCDTPHNLSTFGKDYDDSSEGMWALGLVSNKEIIAADVQAKAIARALRNNH